MFQEEMLKLFLEKIGRFKQTPGNKKGNRVRYRLSCTLYKRIVIDSQ